MTCGVYKITNKTNGHCYIGSALNIKKRWSEHVRALRRGKHHSRYFQRAFDKHGEDVFEFSILSVCSPDELLKREQKFMDEQEPSYNVSPVAGSHLGMKWSDEAKEKHSRLLKSLGIKPPSRAGTTHETTQETRMKIAHANTGTKRSPESKEKMRMAKLGKKLTPEHIANIKASKLTRKEKP